MIGLLLTSRNNYELLREWYSLTDNAGLEILNIDEDSTDEQKALGEKYCKELGITYMDREERGLQNNLTTACNYFEEKGIEWVVHFQHDCYPLNDNFFIKLKEYLSDGKLDEFGVVGFNILHGPKDMVKWNGDDTPVLTTARTPLEPGDNWYRHKDQGHPTRYVHPIGEKRPFVVESVLFVVAMINIKQYNKYITPTGEYHFFGAWDDVAFQFLYQNVYNIVLPQFSCAHEQHRKPKHGIPKSSPTNVAEREHYFGKWGHLEVWKERWGFEFSNPQSRIDFEKIKEEYKDTLLYEFYQHDPINGPMKFLDL